MAWETIRRFLQEKFPEKWQKSKIEGSKSSDSVKERSASVAEIKTREEWWVAERKRRRDHERERLKARKLEREGKKEEAAKVLAEANLAADLEEERLFEIRDSLVF